MALLDMIAEGDYLRYCMEGWSLKEVQLTVFKSTNLTRHGQVLDLSYEQQASAQHQQRLAVITTPGIAHNLQLHNLLCKRLQYAQPHCASLGLAREP